MDLYIFVLVYMFMCLYMCVRRIFWAMIHVFNVVIGMNLEWSL